MRLISKGGLYLTLTSIQENTVYEIEKESEKEKWSKNKLIKRNLVFTRKQNKKYWRKGHSVGSSLL